MGDKGRGLRPLTRAALLDFDDMGELGLDHLYVLALPGAGIEVWETPHSERVPFGYSGIQHLVDACGEGQPFDRLTVAELERATDGLGSVLVALDVWHPEGHRYPRPDPRETPDPEPVDAVPDDGILLVPTRPRPAGARAVEVELIADTAGQRVLCAFTSWEMLVMGCGPHQAWEPVAGENLSYLAYEVGADQVCFDPVLPKHSRHRAPVLDWTRE